MTKAIPSNPTALAALRFKRTPFPRPATLTAYADDGQWSTRDRLDCAAVLAYAHAATRSAEGFPPVANVACDFAADLHSAIAANAFESTRPEIAAGRRGRLAQAVSGLSELREPAAFFLRAGQAPEVARYTKAVCDALRVAPTAKWLAHPANACRFALACIYLAAGYWTAANDKNGGHTND